MTRTEEILIRVDQIPVIPASGHRIIEMANDPDVEMSDLLRVIEHDPGLTSNLLRIANSAYYGRAGKIGSLRDAITDLGLNSVYRIAIASIVSTIMQSGIKGYGLSPGELWQHSIAVAIGTDIASRKTGVSLPAAAFTAGLLHDIGKIVMGTFMEVDAVPIMEVMNSERVSFDVAERKVLGMDHADVGRQLLEKWGLPLEIIRAVEYHHKPEEAEDPIPIVDFIHISDALSMMGGMGTGSFGMHYRPSEEIVKRYGLKVAVLEEIMLGMVSMLDEMSEIFMIRVKPGG